METRRQIPDTLLRVDTFPGPRLVGVHCSSVHNIGTWRRDVGELSKSECDLEIHQIMRSFMESIATVCNPSGHATIARGSLPESIRIRHGAPQIEASRRNWNVSRVGHADEDGTRQAAR